MTRRPVTSLLHWKNPRKVAWVFMRSNFRVDLGFCLRLLLSNALKASLNRAAAALEAHSTRMEVSSFLYS